MSLKEEFLITPREPTLVYLRDIFRYRETLLVLSWREVLVRYKDTLLGVGWSILRPLVTMTAFALVFGRIAGLSRGEESYFILVLAAVIPWQFFSSSVDECGSSLILNRNLVTKVYFPRILIPLSTMLTSFIELIVSLIILAILMAWFGVLPSWRLLCLPVFLLIMIICSAGVGLWVAALNVKYRDFRYILPFALQIGAYASPVGYPASAVPDHWRVLYAMNPMVGIMEGFRWSILGHGCPDLPAAIAASVFLSFLVLGVGALRFYRTETYLSDVI
jgi:lipopolysaccharide transport system permease protein